MRVELAIEGSAIMALTYSLRVSNTNVCNITNNLVYCRTVEKSVEAGPVTIFEGPGSV